MLRPQPKHLSAADQLRSIRDAEESTRKRVPLTAVQDDDGGGR